MISRVFSLSVKSTPSVGECNASSKSRFLSHDFQRPSRSKYRQRRESDVPRYATQRVLREDGKTRTIIQDSGDSGVSTTRPAISGDRYWSERGSHSGLCTNNQTRKIRLESSIQRMEESKETPASSRNPNSIRRHGIWMGPQ